jgi:parvulin-like peptidyl-prolyl isomerase
MPRDIVRIKGVREEKMSVRICFLTVIMGVLLTGGTRAEELNPVVGKAGDFVLREADLDRLIGNQSPEFQRSLREQPAQRINLVRQILLTEAVAAKARREGFDRKPEVREQVSYLIDQYLAQEYIGKVVVADVLVPEQELKKYYQEHEKDFILPEAIKARHIFFEAAIDAAPEVKGKARAKAEEVLRRLRNGEEFSSLAKEFSQDADSAAKGGELGWISPGKTNSEEFEKVLFALKAGETGDIVETPFGFHIIRVDERRDKRTATFDETREQILNRLKGELAQKKTQDFLDKLSKDTGLVIAGEKKGDNGQGTGAGDK